MIMDEFAMEDGATKSGSVNSVQRVGDTVRRPKGHWTPNIHALLDHLEINGFGGAPRAAGFDEFGREILSYIPGRVALRPWPKEMRSHDGIKELATWLFDYHALVRDFVPPAPNTWRIPDSMWSTESIVRHGDLGPWNTIWHQGHLAAVIDWDQAEPGSSLEDVAQMAWYNVPLRGHEHAQAVGEFTIADLRKRFHVLCETYGEDPAKVLKAVTDIQTKEIVRIESLGQSGREPWRSFLLRDDVSEITKERAWTEAQGHALVH